ncbi:MAG: 1,4-beta-xylanase, partial [Actinomycetota bacterium]
MKSGILRTLSGLACALAVAVGIAQPAAAEPRWTKEQANAWHKKTGWLVGCNYAPATAVNQIEMWQKETFDPATIDRELGWA